MVPSINDVLDIVEFQSFVGRHTELELMKEQLVVKRNQWNSLHFHGMNGIGKTALLLRFMKKHPAIRMVYVDTSVELQSPQHFLEKIAKQLHMCNRTNDVSLDNRKSHRTTDIIHKLNTIATKESPLILLFDSFELWKPIIEWLFESFIPKLSAEVRLISAGREPLEGKWMHANSWSLLMKNIQLKSLSQKHVYKYLNIVGIDDPTLQKRVFQLSNGIPFAMKHCSAFLNENDQNIGPTDTKQIIRDLCQNVLEELDVSVNQRTLLDAASVVGKFDKELLMNITNQKLSFTDFDQFCSIEIITKAQDGWTIYNGVRNWLQSDFKEHSPELFNCYKKRALVVLYRRWKAADPIKRRSLFLENVYAGENKLLQEYYFLGDETVYDIRTAEQQDIAPIMEIWKNRHLNTLQSVNDGTVQEKLIQAVWELEPSAIKSFWENDRIVGFTSIVSLTREAREIFLKNNLYRNYLLHTKPEENERLFWIGATAERDDYQALNAIFRYFFEHLMDKCLCTVMFPTDYNVSGLLSLGFKELPWAAAVSPSGKKFRMLQVDFRETSLLQLLTTSYPIEMKKAIPLEEGIQIIKKLLLSYYDFESDQELFQAAIALIDHKDSVSTGEDIRRAIKNAMKEIECRTEKDRLLMRTLELSYINRIGTNEIVAERLHLSVSTYYRYVNKGIEALALQFV